jgi:hypothetical protein
MLRASSAQTDPNDSKRRTQSVDRYLVPKALRAAYPANVARALLRKRQLGADDRAMAWRAGHGQLPANSRDSI